MGKDKRVVLEVHPNGVIKTLYKESVISKLQDEGAKIKNIGRASLIEWENYPSATGWVIRSAHDRNLAVRWGYDDVEETKTLMVSKYGDLAFFDSKKAALKIEEKFFWELIKPKET